MSEKTKSGFAGKAVLPVVWIEGGLEPEGTGALCLDVTLTQLVIDKRNNMGIYRRAV